MREITDHKVNPANDVLTLVAADGPGPGGASHKYEITLPGASGLAHREPVTITLDFQNGPIAESGVNGITHEVLISILIDRMEGFQSGPFANEFNALALDHLKSAQAALHQRTTERMARGVEGTNKQ